MLNFLFILVIALVSVVVILFGLLRLWTWEEARKKRRKPSKEKLLRSPGEYLRAQLEANDENLLIGVAVLVSVPVTMVATFVSPNKPAHINWAEQEPAVFVSGIFVLAAVLGIIHLLKKRQVLRLGYSGERAVGEELNKLMLDGFQVFHDVPFDKYNIDHVVVGPSGVYAVETKTRRKLELEKPATGDEHRIVLYGGKVLFPSGHKEEKSLEQARWNARTLSKFLTSSTGEKVEAQPILTYPGWFVEPGDSCDVGVLNPKMIRNFVVRNGQVVLSEQRIRQIVHQLDQKCRTVEF